MCKELVLTKRQKYMLLPKSPFTSWFTWHERLTEEQAKAKWAECKRDTNVQREVTDGRLCLAVKQYKEYEEAKKLRSSKRMKVGGERCSSPTTARSRVLDGKHNLGTVASYFMFLS